ncbi:MAG TPA: insulinase family protein, partial [Frankiaceae bacterium]|nr:insulinase family protein [Frankiaceae bacterium]
YGRHPYGSETPLPDTVARVTAAQLCTLHARRMSPVGSVLTLVGALQPEEALDGAEASLGGWGGGAPPSVPPVSEHRPGPVVIVDRPGAVQTNVRLGGPALDRRDPAHPAQQLASTVFGGYFTSRLVSNIREDKGYSYSPRSGVEHLSAASRFGVGADVATEVTGPALLEVGYELGRMAVLPVGEDELEAARRYAIGTLALSTATSAGLASTLSVLAGAGLGVEYLREHPAALARVTSEDVLAVAGAVLAPARLATVLLGDREKIAAWVSALGEVRFA